MAIPESVTTQPGHKGRKRRRRRIVGIACFALLLFALGVFAVICKTMRDDSARLPSTLEQARELGLPLTMDALLLRVPAIPDSQSAEHDFRAARQEYERVAERKFRDLFLDPSPANLERRAEAIQSFVPTLRVLEKAVLKPGPDFRGDEPAGTWWFRVSGFGEGTRERSDMRHIGIYLEDKIREDDTADALRDLKTLEALAEHGPEYQPGYDWDWRVWQFWSVLTEARWALFQHHDDPDVIDSVDRLAKGVKLPSLYKSLEFDFAQGRRIINDLKSIRQVADVHAPEAVSNAMDALYQAPGVKQAFDDKFVQAYVDAFRGLPRDQEDWVRIYTALGRSERAVSHDHSLQSWMVKALGVGNPTMALTCARIEVLQRMLIEACGAFRQHLATGKYPDKLPIGGMTAIDPLWQRPYHYEASATGFAMRTDPRHFDRRTPSWTGNGIVFQFPPPPRRTRTIHMRFN